jgi:predicted nucleotidyltransferase
LRTTQYFEGGGQMEQERKELKKIEEIVKENKVLLTKQFKVKEIGIFGSVVRGEDKETSDVDILVEFVEPIGFFKFLELEDLIQKVLEDEET